MLSLGCPIGRLCLCTSLPFSGNDTLVLFIFVFNYNFRLYTGVNMISIVYKNLQLFSMQQIFKTNSVDYLVQQLNLKFRFYSRSYSNRLYGYGNKAHFFTFSNHEPLSYQPPFVTSPLSSPLTFIKIPSKISGCGTQQLCSTNFCLCICVVEEQHQALQKPSRN